jgi:RNA polymerase sigma-70 factor (ECF subfamily)
MKGKGPLKSSLDQSKDEAELSQMMRSSQGGDSESYHRLLTRIRDMLLKYVENSFVRFGLGGKGGQEDVLQEILLAVHMKRHTYDPEQFFLPWMYAVARYKVIDFLRKHKVSLRSTISLDDELENVENLMVFESSVELDIEALCETLPEKQKNVLKLVKLEGLSVEEAAKRTGYSASDIKVTVHRAIKALQEKVSEAHHENR